MVFMIKKKKKKKKEEEEEEEEEKKKKEKKKNCLKNINIYHIQISSLYILVHKSLL